jgi:hypothetical protein
VQKLLPHKLSDYSPALAVGDIDNDGLDDMVVGGDSYNQAQVFIPVAQRQIQAAQSVAGQNVPAYNF